jgi:hypothetical protein
MRVRLTSPITKAGMILPADSVIDVSDDTAAWLIKIGSAKAESIEVIRSTLEDSGVLTDAPPRRATRRN